MKPSAGFVKGTLLLVLILLATPIRAQKARSDAIKLVNPKFSVTTDLGRATFQWQMDTAPGSEGGAFNLQLWLLHKESGRYVNISPINEKGRPLRIDLYPDGTENRGEFTADLEKGSYGGGRCILFVAGSGFSKVATQFPVPDLGLTVATSEVRIKKATLEVDPIQVRGSEVVIPYRVKIPARFRGNRRESAAWWLQVKGAGQFRQQWLQAARAEWDTNPDNEYGLFQGEMVLPLPEKPGLYHAEVMLFNSGWKMIHYVWPRPQFDVGDWVQRCPPQKHPSLEAALDRGKAPFAIGGNYGNALVWTNEPAHNNVGYFTLLRVKVGLKFLRFAFNADRYLESPTYRRIVEQVAHNMLLAKVIPVVGPQDLPKGRDMNERIARMEQVAVLLAKTFKGIPHIQDLYSEPHDFKKWEQVKPVHERLIRAVRAINPDGPLCVGLEGWSYDARSASENPLSPDLARNVYYGWHPYRLSPEQLKTNAGHGLPLWLQEYHDARPETHKAMEEIPNLKIVSAWAWNVLGQDRLPLVARARGADFELNARGQQLLSYYQTWWAGNRIDLAQARASFESLGLNTAQAQSPQAGAKAGPPKATDEAASDGERPGRRPGRNRDSEPRDQDVTPLGAVGESPKGDGGGPRLPYVLLALSLLLLIPIAIWVWPTPWRYYLLQGVPVRANRFNGEVQFLDFDGWKRGTGKPLSGALRGTEPTQDA